MKKITLTAAIIFIGITAFAQSDFLAGFAKAPNTTAKDLSFELHGRYDRPVYKEQIEKAKLLSDFVDGYPSNWIDEYISVEILAINNGKELSATGPNDKLTTEQKNILKAADLSTDVVINVNYKYHDPLTKSSNDNSINITKTVINIKMTVIPETQAEFAAGKKEMTTYLKETVMNKITDAVAKHVEFAQLLFTVNENGEIENAKIAKTSGDEKTDQLILDAINNMPKWKSAKNSKGIKVKQDFEFSVYKGGC